MKTDTEIGGVGLQTRECQAVSTMPEAGGGRMDPPRAFRAHAFLPTPGFQSSGLWNSARINEFILRPPDCGDLFWP